MPPASRLDSADVFGACLRQWTRIAEAVERLPDSVFGAATGLPGWRGTELVAHLAMCAASPARWLAEPVPSKAVTDAASYLLCLRAAAPDIDLRTRERTREPTREPTPECTPERLRESTIEHAVEHAAEKPPAQLRAEVRHAVEELAAVLADADPARVIPTRLAPMRLDEFVVTRCVEGVVHGLDLDPVLDPDPVALKITVKALLACIVAKAPGHTVEVRVPPIAAVQCVAGPRHTRGTPSNVVETDPITWVRLAAGRLPWVDAAGDGRLRASGERSDISALLPLL